MVNSERERRSADHYFTRIGDTELNKFDIKTQIIPLIFRIAFFHPKAKVIEKSCIIDRETPKPEFFRLNCLNKIVQVFGNTIAKDFYRVSPGFQYILNLIYIGFNLHF